MIGQLWPSAFNTDAKLAGQAEEVASNADKDGITN